MATMPGFTGFVAILFSFNCQRQDYTYCRPICQHIFSVSSQRFNGAEPRSLARRINTEENAHRAGKHPSSVVVLGKFRCFLFTFFIPSSPHSEFSPYFQHFFDALLGLFFLQIFFLYVIIIALYSTLWREVFYVILLKKR